MAQNDNSDGNKPNLRKTPTSQQSKDQPQVPIDQETIKALISNQTLSLQNQKSENEIRIKEIETNARLSEKSLEIQKAVLENQGKDFRMTITRFAYIAFGFLLLILLFIGFCLRSNKDAFAYKFCQGISYVITTVLGYIFGSRSATKNKKDQSNSDENIF